MATEAESLIETYSACARSKAWRKDAAIVVSELSMRSVLSQHPIKAFLEIFGCRQLDLFLNMVDKDNFVSKSFMLMAGFKVLCLHMVMTACSLYHSSCSARPYPPMPLVHNPHASLAQLSAGILAAPHQPHIIVCR